MTIKPNNVFTYTRADEVAETWEGVPHALYCTLWNDIVPHQKPIPNIEDTGPADHVGFENLAAHWHRLTPEDQTLLNKLAAEKDAEYEAWRNKGKDTV